MVRIEMVLGRGLAWRGAAHPGPGGDHQVTVGACERVTERLDGPPICLADLVES